MERTIVSYASSTTYAPPRSSSPPSSPPVLYSPVSELLRGKPGLLPPTQPNLKQSTVQRELAKPGPELTLGTTKIKNLDDNLGCVRVKLSKDDLKEISDAVTVNEVAGDRIPSEGFEKISWRYANTPPPPKDSKLSA